MAWQERITIDAAICHGKPCVRGLRYPVETIPAWLAAGDSFEEILAEDEELEREDLLAVLADAVPLADVQRVKPIAA